MPYFQQQQQQGPFSWLDVILQSLHPAIDYGLAGVGTVGMYFYGLQHPGLPLVIYIGIGFLGGLLATVILRHLTEFLICAALVVAATFATYYLLRNEAALRHAAPAAQTAPVNAPKSSPGSLLDDLKKALVQP